MHGPTPPIPGAAPQDGRRVAPQMMQMLDLDAAVLP